MICKELATRLLKDKLGMQPLPKNPKGLQPVLDKLQALLKEADNEVMRESKGHEGNIATAVALGKSKAYCDAIKIVMCFALDISLDDGLPLLME